jgi:hypothetical protein
MPDPPAPDVIRDGCSVVVPWCDRAELARSLHANGPIYERYDIEPIIISLGGHCGRLMKMIEGVGIRQLRAFHVPEAKFNRSLGLNLGIGLSRSRHVFLMDADIVLASDVFDNALPILSSGARYVSMRRIIESDRLADNVGSGDSTSNIKEIIRSTELVMVDGRRARVVNVVGGGARSGHGLILARRDHLVAVGGLNSAFSGWGFEDSDLQLRLQLAMGLTMADVGDVIHLSHESVGSLATWSSNKNQAMEKYGRGDYKGTLAEDLVKWLPKTLELPRFTKYPCIESVESDG